MMRTTWTKYLVPLLLAVALAACGGGSGTGGQDPGPDPPPPPPPPWPPPIPLLPVWQEPPCNSVSGPPVATFSVNGGVTLTPNDEAVIVGPESRTQSIVALPLWGGRVFAAQGVSVYHSFDGGCTWEHMLDATEPLRLLPQNLPWYAFGIGGRGDTLYVLGSGYSIFDIPFQAIDLAPTRFSTLHALTSDGRIMRLEFNVFEQDQWVEVTDAPAGSPRFLAVNPGRSPFDPAHLVVSMASGPPMVTLDGGTSWHEAQGVLDGADSVETGRAYFSQEFAQTDATVAWIVIARTRTDSDTGTSVDERAIARSTDGGLSFVDVVVADGVNILIDDDLIDSDRISPIFPTEDELMFASGGCPDAEPRLYRYDASDDTLTVISWSAGESLGVDSMSYLGRDPAAGDLIYLGHRSVDTCD